MADIRMPLSDKAIARLSAPKEGSYLARDTELKGFFLVVGKRKKTFTMQGDLRQHGKRTSSIRVAIGDTSKMSTRSARATAKDYLAQISRGQHPKAGARPAKAGNTRDKAPATAGGVTLKEAWQRYRDAHLVRRVAANARSKAIAITWNASSWSGWRRRCRRLRKIQLVWRRSMMT
jgi:hypothetical protein